MCFLLGFLYFDSRSGTRSVSTPVATRPPASAVPEPRVLTASESLLEGYGDPSAPPIEDLRKIHRVVTGYYTLVKDGSRFPIGGNEDFSAALRGGNPNREVFVRPGHRAFSPSGLLIDRWGGPLIIHPEAWRELEIRSAGPDGIPYNGDDLILSPAGKSISPQQEAE